MTILVFKPLKFMNFLRYTKPVLCTDHEVILQFRNNFLSVTGKGGSFSKQENKKSDSLFSHSIINLFFIHIFFNILIFLVLIKELVLTLVLLQGFRDLIISSN